MKKLLLIISLLLGTKTTASASEQLCISNFCTVANVTASICLGMLECTIHSQATTKSSSANNFFHNQFFIIAISASAGAVAGRTIPWIYGGIKNCIGRLTHKEIWSGTIDFESHIPLKMRKLEFLSQEMILIDRIMSETTGFNKRPLSFINHKLCRTSECFIGYRYANQWGNRMEIIFNPKHMSTLYRIPEHSSSVILETPFHDLVSDLRDAMKLDQESGELPPRIQYTPITSGYDLIDNPVFQEIRNSLTQEMRRDILGYITDDRYKREVEAHLFNDNKFDLIILTLSVADQDIFDPSIILIF